MTIVSEYKQAVADSVRIDYVDTLLDVSKGKWCNELSIQLIET
jgi:hypothetical protein